MGERRDDRLWTPTFNSALQVEASDAPLTSDAGALVLREVAHRTGLYDLLRVYIPDDRDPTLITYPLVTLLMTRILLMAQGWRDLDDADDLRHDVAMRAAVADARGDVLAEGTLPSQPTMSRMEARLAVPGTCWLLHKALVDHVVTCIRKEHGRRDVVDIDMDSFPMVAHGHPEGAIYNGHYRETCHHPIVAHVDGYVLGVLLRPGNVHTAKDALPFLEPLISMMRSCAKKLWIRIDNGYASGDTFDWLDAQRVRFVTRLKRCNGLSKLTADWRKSVRAEWDTTRDPGVRREATREFRYKADSWSRERRIIAVMVERLDGDGELFDDLFFLCTNAAMYEGSSAAILKRYRKRGSAEHNIGELVNVIAPRLPHATLEQNDATLMLGCIAYNLVHHLRRGLERVTAEGWSLGRVRDNTLKVAAMVIRHARRLVFRVAPSATHAWSQLDRVFATPASATNTEVTA